MRCVDGKQETFETPMVSLRTGLGDKMVEFWETRGNMMETIQASPGYTDTMVSHS